VTDLSAREPRTVLTIAGSDSGGGAGIQADLKTFAAHGCYGVTAITAVTAQNTVAVTAAHALPTELVTAQIEAVAADITVHATKTGMLATAAIVEAVAAAIAALDLPNLVVDPVMVAKSGDTLLDPDAVRAMCAELVPLARVVTPNIPEAEAMTGLRIRTLDDVRQAAARIRDMGPTAVVIKGGHADGDDIVDLLMTADGVRELHVPRIHTRNTHGTGCTFASAIAAQLALGRSVPEAVAHAQAYVAGAIRHALAIGHGHGPLDHFWQSRALS
jgi:hydroxymethylpyrimidine/phosphomethylpyrimidine kinase